MLSPVQAVEDRNLLNEKKNSVFSMSSLSSNTLSDLNSISIFSTTSVTSMLSGRELHSNIFTGSTPSINYFDLSSSIVSITENESSIPVIDFQVNKFEEKITFVITLDLNRFPRLTRDGTCVIKMYLKNVLYLMKECGY